QHVIARVDSFVITVDAHNIVPAFVVSAKAEYGAYTLRPKINKLLPVFMDSYPELPSVNRITLREFPSIDWEEVKRALCTDLSVSEVDWCLPGEDEAHKMLHHFVEHKLEQYASKRNDPVAGATSGLSPYLHFGQISAQHVAQSVLKAGASPESSAAFLEELIVRRELADNFCFYNPDYDSFNGFPEWARKSLDVHRGDKRDFIYSFEEFEKAATHDDLWNAAQKEMVVYGKMHGFMRMYWAKKILEWTASPEVALNTAIKLHNKYSLDGRDPNTYAGCSWAIGGVHDRAWNRHPVYGMIRYMNYNGCKRKFDVNAYVKQFSSISLF
ncbi:MAG TPA: hypothetical protein VHO90_17395, partial [Bacteroidales bacterium]|nr:hypothetical protein [Bacteroidales bacterium]